jgi:biopolymer transport protein TolQ
MIRMDGEHLRSLWAVAQQQATDAAAKASTAGGGEQLDMVELVKNSSGVVLGVLVVLVLMSIISWYIIGYKILYLNRAGRETREFLDHFWGSKRLDSVFKQAEKLKRSPVSQVFQAGYIELSKLKNKSAEDGATMSGKLTGIENIERSLQRAQTAELTHLEGLVPFLATTGSTAPFIGLFGTVWGIMNAFVALGATQTNLGIQAVAGPIAEALIATAIGLLAAIPSVMAYNYFSQRIKVLSSEMDTFSNDFLNIVKRHFFN